MASPYSVDDTVAHNSRFFICIADHVSGPSSEPGVGGSWATYWKEVGTPTGFTGVITFYAATTSGGAADQLQTVTIENGIITDWVQGTPPPGTPGAWQFDTADNSQGLVFGL